MRRVTDLIHRKYSNFNIMLCYMFKAKKKKRICRKLWEVRLNNRIIAHRDWLENPVIVPIHIAPSHGQQGDPSRLIANSVGREQLARPGSRTQTPTECFANWPISGLTKTERIPSVTKRNSRVLWSDMDRIWISDLRGSWMTGRRTRSAVGLSVTTK